MLRGFIIIVCCPIGRCKTVVRGRDHDVQRNFVCSAVFIKSHLTQTCTTQQTHNNQHNTAHTTPNIPTPHTPHPHTHFLRHTHTHTNTHTHTHTHTHRHARHGTHCPVQV